MKSKSNKKEIAQLKKIIEDPRTSEEEKKRFQGIIDKIESSSTISNEKPKKTIASSIEDIVWIDNPDGGQYANYKLGTIKRVDDSKDFTVKFGVNEPSKNAISIEDAKKKIDEYTDNKTKSPKTEEKIVTPDCDTLIESYKANKKARLARQAGKKADTRTPEKKFIDTADKKVTSIINNIKKMSKKKQLSKKTRKDLLTILNGGISHIEKA